MRHWAQLLTTSTKYQARGAPHYHILLWIEGAPIAGKDEPEEVLRWIQNRINCRIPEEDSNPELHQLVTKYQRHKCSGYCQRRKKVKGTYITYCRFGFPRAVCESATLKTMEECLKGSQRQVYELPRSPEEIRINNYNPLLLMLWKANMDIQFIAESTLATIAQYVTRYVTKAEKTNMQDLWQEVSSHQSIYSKLWSFGVRSLRSRECGLYEASDLLLGGDHLCGKSQTIKWVDVSQPHNRKRRLPPPTLPPAACGHSAPPHPTVFEPPAPTVTGSEGELGKFWQIITTTHKNCC